MIASSLGEDLLASCLEAYDAAGSPPVPAGLLHHDGPAPTIDCGDLLIVQLVSLTSAFQGPPEACAIVPRFTYSVTVTRCIPNLNDWGSVAGDAELTAAAVALADDAMTLWAGVTADCKAGTLWVSVPSLECADTQFRDMRPGAQGGIGWWTWTVVVAATANLA